MDNKTIEIICQEETLQLDYRRCIYWPSHKTLLLADVHLGKDNIFRQHGMAIPEGISEDNLNHIRQLLHEYKPEQLLILGDFVHAVPSPQEPWISSLAKLIHEFSSTVFTIVSGNHDKPGTANRLPDEINWTNVVDISPFHFRHEPLKTESKTSDKYTICGHLHPCITLSMRKGPTIRMPVFWVSPEQLVLPAFGGFTGMHTIRPSRRDKCIGIGPDSLVELRSQQFTIPIRGTTRI